MSVILTQEELERLCREWQKILRLQDWDIKVKICRQNDMTPDSQADSTWTLPKKTAIIRLCDPIDYIDVAWPQDMERSLVHELLHLHLAPIDDFEPGTIKDILLEQAVDAMSKALITFAANRLSSPGRYVQTGICIGQYAESAT